MTLTHIHFEACPECGAVTVQDSCRAWIVNRQPSEEREFACGCRLAWSPGSRQLEVKKQCPKNPAEAARLAKRAAAAKAATDFVRSLDVDDDWKSLVTDKVALVTRWGI